MGLLKVASNVQVLPLRQVKWRGRSGRFLPHVPLRQHEFTLREGEQ